MDVRGTIVARDILQFATVVVISSSLGLQYQLAVWLSSFFGPRFNFSQSLPFVLEIMQF